MVFHKVQKAIAIATMASLVATSAPIPNYIKVIEANAKATVEDNISKDDEGVYRVTMDETGYLTADANEAAATVDTPFSWDNVNMYFVITDRFLNGDKSNDHSYGRSVGEVDADKYETRIGTFHGGDLAGLTSKIEEGYFDELGTNAIWITAPYEQIHGALSSDKFKHYAYHGYYVLDYSEVDQNMGTEKELEKFIDTAHEHGIRVVFDIVLNHAGYADPVTVNEYFGEGTSALSSNWKELYYNTSEKEYQWYWDYNEVGSEYGKAGMMVANSGDWKSKWWGTSWIRAIPERFSGYEGKEESGIETCLDGLPDFKTENKSDPGIPTLLKTKWTKEGVYDQKVKDTEESLKRAGLTPGVTAYISAWLSDWVYKYGVDGFRCDTAKHVRISEWVTLKNSCKKALQDWRKNNPDKPGAQWNDEFWMTGEAWGHGMENDEYFTSGAFDSMINFKYQGNEKNSGASLEGIFSDYASKLNNDPNFNVLSYISSHDTALGARSAGAGTAFLLNPGGVQTYYGDESGRQDSGATQKHGTRSHMNWDSIDKNILGNWQKVGQFRRNHIAVGAGQHTKIAGSPYTFSRTYTGKATVGAETKTDYEDKVVVCLPGSAGTVDVSVGDVFMDGDTVVDEYTGTEYTVSGGKVSATCDGNGVILLAEPTVSGPKAKVMTAVTKGKESGGVYNTDSLSLKLSVQNVKDATYQVNDLTPVELKESAEITIGEDTAYEEKTTITIKGTSEIDGTAVEKTFTYSRGKEPVIGADDEGFTLRIKKSDFTSAPSIWVWSGKTNYCTNIWPGDTLKEDGDFYVYSNAKITGEANFIISHGTSYRNTKEGETELSAKGSVLFDKATNKTEEYAVQTGDPCKVTVEYLDGSGNVIKTITRVGAEGDAYTVYAPEYLSTVAGAKLAEGEKTSKTGTFTTKGETVQFNYSVNGEVIQTPAPATTEPAPATTEPAPTEPSKKTVAPATTEPAPATTEPAPTEPSKKTVAPATTEPAPATTEPAPATTEPAKETVAPATTEPAQNTPMPTQGVGTIQTNAPTATPSQDIDEEFEVSILASTKSVVAGKSVKLTASAFGGNGNYQYKFVAEKSGSKSTLRSYAKTPTYTWKPTKAGKYTITVTAKDVETGTLATEDVKITVTAAPVKITKFIAKSLGKLKVQLQANATGGKSTLKYKYTYTFNKKTKTVKNYSTTKKLTTTLKKAGTYKFKLYVYDSSNKKVIKTKTVTVKVKK